MPNLTPLVRAAAIVALAAAAWSPLGYAQLPVVRIGMALDGPAQWNAEAVRIFEQEISILLRDEYEVRFPREKRLVADWTAAGVADALERLLADDEVDFVLALGILTSSQAMGRGQLPKPVIAPYVVDPELQGAPVQVKELQLPPPDEPERVNVSGVANLNYLPLGVRLLQEVSLFRDIVSFDELTVLALRAWQEAIPRVEEDVLRTLAPLNLDRIRNVWVGDSLQEALDAIPDDTQAVYITPLPQFSSADLDRLAQALIDRRIPSFSMLGREDVNRGILAGLGAEDETKRRARRVGLNIQQILEGAAAQDLSVDFVRRERLAINMATARAIGVSPRFTLLIEADLLHGQRSDVRRTLSLSSVIREAAMTNLDLAAEDRTVAAGLGQVRQARSGLLPGFAVNAGAAFVDGDRAEALAPLPQRQYTLSLQGSQLIYSDQVWAGYQIAKRFQDQRQEVRAQLRLDIILEAAESYLNVLRAQTIDRIQRDNLELTRSNLELARSRVEIGVAGREEVFRWESQIATNQRDVIEAQALRNQAEIAVNRVLNRPLDERFGTIESTLGDPELVSSFEAIGPFIESPGAFEVFSDFMQEEALAASPELRQLDALVRASERALSTARRDSFLPDFILTAEATGLEGDGRGAISLPGLNAWDWTVRVDATLPIFEGGALSARLFQAREELQESRLRRNAAAQRVGQRIRSVLEETSASFVAIELSQRAAEAARSNLQLVAERYAQGVVGILALLDAQSQALIAELAASNAVFDYLIDLMGVQRAAGRFDYYRSTQQRQEFLNRVGEYFRQSGFRVRRP